MNATTASDAENLLRTWRQNAPSRGAAEALVPGLWSALGARRALAALAGLAGEGGARREILLDAALECARGMVHRGEAAPAQALLGFVLRLSPRRAEAHLLAGIERRYARDLAGAAARYRRALALAPRSPRVCLYAAENLLFAGRARPAMKALADGLARCRGARPSGPLDLTEHYRLRAAAFDFEGAERLGEALMRLPPDPATAERLCWIPLVEHFDLFTRPLPYLAALSRALLRYEARRPGSPWPAFFRVLFLWHGYRPERERARRDWSRLGGLVSGPRDWMLAPAAVAAESARESVLARDYRRRARAAGVLDHLDLAADR